MVDEYAQDKAQLEESVLIGRCADGDTEAFAQLVKSKRLLVHRIAARICSPDEADDIAQLVFLKLWREMPRLRDATHLNRWLVRATVNQAIDTARHVGRRLKLVMRSREQTPPVEADRLLRQGEVAWIFSEVAGWLGERQRAAFVLREIEGLSSREVAEALCVTPSTVRNLVHQARQGLRRALRERFPEYAPADAETKGN